MKFWKFLRWVASILFVAVLVISWLVQPPSSHRFGTDSSDPPQSPSFR